MNSTPRQKAALVLSGGSVLGLAHLGVLEVLEKYYEFEVIYGVSAGSLVGAGLASGMSTREIQEAFFSTNFSSILRDVSTLNTGLFRGVKLREHFDELLDGKAFTDLEIPLRIGTTNFDSGEYVQIKEGRVSDAMRASCALPMLFEPYHHPETGQYLADGGLTRNLPLQDALDEYKGDTIIAINVHPLYDLPTDFHKKKLFGWKKDLTAYLHHSFNIMVNAQWHDNDDPRVHIIEPELKAFKGYSIHKKNYEPIIEAGRKAGERFLDSQK